MKNNQVALLWHMMGLMVGFCDGRDDQQYDDGSSRVHGLTVCIPGIGSSAFAAGYRDGFLSGQGERLKTR